LFLQKTEVYERKLSNEQEELLDLLNYTIDSGRGDFAEWHDHHFEQAGYKISMNINQMRDSNK
jgi:hypothetical protein